MNVTETAIPEVLMLKTEKFGDHRGFFSETYNKQVFADAGIKLDFVQDNHSRSATRGTLRGLHFQGLPFAQDKLVRVVKGAILDVAVDIRRSSRTFGTHVAIELTAEDWNQALVPIGFAHGFVTLTPDTEVIYKVTNYYAPQHDFGLAWDDPELAIAWPFSATEITLSEKDARQPRLSELIKMGRLFS
jgi:dTDP-4-dehydrorhamnose 3,5-epimerase